MTTNPPPDRLDRIEDGSMPFSRSCCSKSFSRLRAVSGALRAIAIGLLEILEVEVQQAIAGIAEAKIEM